MRSSFFLLITIIFLSCASNRNLEIQGTWFSGSLDEEGKRTSTTPTIFHFGNDTLHTLSLTHFDRDQSQSIFSFYGDNLETGQDKFSILFQQDSFKLSHSESTKERTFYRVKSALEHSPTIARSSYKITSTKDVFTLRFLNDSVFVNLENGRRDFWKQTNYGGFTFVCLGQINPFTVAISELHDNGFNSISGYSTNTIEWEKLKPMSHGKDTCVFNNDIKGLTIDWAIKQELENFQWDEKSQQLVVSEMYGYDRLILQKGGCSHFGKNATLITGPQIKNVSDTSFWKGRILKIASDLGFEDIYESIKNSQCQWDVQVDNLIISIQNEEVPINLIIDDIVVTKQQFGFEINLSQYYN